jgi:hypothetical protein
VTENDIKSFEEKYNVSIPKFFKDFLLKYNDTDIEENWIEEGNYYISFLPLKSDINVSIENVVSKIRYKDDDNYEYYIGRDDLIPFAMEQSNYFICMSIGEIDFGCIYITKWDENNKKPLIKISDTLDDFVNLLREDKALIKQIAYDRGKWGIEFILRKIFINGSYREGITKVKSRILEHHYYLETWSDLKLCIKDRIFFKNELLSIFRTYSIELKENTQEEAYKWIELLIKNVELKDESQIVEYPLLKDVE